MSTFRSVTTALDSATEAKIQLALKSLTRGRTTFVIAHRLSTVRGADQILVMKDGRLVEQGKFSELMARNGVFAELNNLGSFISEECVPRALSIGLPD